MEAIAFLAALAILATLASRFGVDSRDGYRGKEQELAAYGVTWADLAHEQELASELRHPRRRPVDIAAAPEQRTRPAGPLAEAA